MALGVVSVDPPLVGAWTWPDYPSVVHINNVRFVLCRYCVPKDGVVQQYRQDVERNSMHLYVLKDGTYYIGHTDDYNPDKGQLMMHGLVDTPLMIPLGVVGALGLLYLLGQKR